MADGRQTTITVGEGNAARPIAVLQRPGTAPGIFWLNGFKSEMTGGKASALDAYGAAHGIAVTRFDYSGHGRSGGDFLDGTTSRWLEEALAVFALTQGPQVVIGSSTGGWLALLLNRALRRSGEARVKALILLAPAVDATQELTKTSMTAAEKRELAEKGYFARASQYSAEPYIHTQARLDDGGRHLLFTDVIETGCPVTILQGGKDPDVPQEHALKLVSHLLHDPVTLTLIPDGDHRLSRPQDLARLEDAVTRALTE